LLYVGAKPLGTQPALLSGFAGHRRTSLLHWTERTTDELCKASRCLLAVAQLRAMSAGGDAERAARVDPVVKLAPYALALRRGEDA
jgi:hypothetical protein